MSYDPTNPDPKFKDVVVVILKLLPTIFICLMVSIPVTKTLHWLLLTFQSLF